MRRKVRIFKWSAPLWSLVALGATATVVFAWGILFYLGAFSALITTAPSGDVTMSWQDDATCSLTGPGTITSCANAADGVSFAATGVTPETSITVSRTIRNDGDAVVEIASVTGSTPAGVSFTHDPAVGVTVLVGLTRTPVVYYEFDDALASNTALPSFNVSWRFELP